MTVTDGGWTAKDRACIELVFGLTGGELADEPWVIEREGDNPWVNHFWYENVPEWAESEFPEWPIRNYRTIVRDTMFGAPPDRLETWTKVATYMNSGETECPGRQEDSFSTPKGVHFEKSANDVPLVRADQCDGGNRCYYCEEKIGDEHGYIYLGDGWAEIVYVSDEEMN